MRQRRLNVIIVSLVLSGAATARAQTPPATDVTPPPGRAPHEVESPQPYVAPFGLRGTGAATAVRAETAYGLNADTSATIVQYLTASYAPTKELSVFARGGWVDFMPSAGSSSTAFTNLAIGGLWAHRLARRLRVAVVLGSGFPSGEGGGSSPDKGEAAAIAAGNLARSRLDGSTMFSPNDLAPFVGGDVAWVSGGLTLQAEATLFELIRVRGSEADPDASKTSLTLGMHAGYFLIPQLSIGIELRDQSFLSTPAAVEAGKISRSWVTVGGGPRVHLRLSRDVWFRPGLAFIQPLDDPSPAISASSYHIVQLDLPLTF